MTNVIQLNQATNETEKTWLDRFGLDWSVEKRPLYTVDANGQAIKLNDQAIVRTDTETVLNVVSSRYSTIQNAVFFDLLADAEKQGFIKNLHGGSFSGGKKTYVQAEFGDPASLKGNDEIRARLLLANSHDGSFSFRSNLSPIRIACMNTLIAAVSDQDTKISIRHTQSHAEKLETLKIVLQSLAHSFEKTMQFYTAFANKQLNRAEVETFIKSVLKLNSKPQNEITENELSRMTRLIQLFETGRGQDLNSKSLWSAFNAVTEFTSHELDTNSAKREEKLLFGQGFELNKRAFELALAMVA